MEFLTFEDETGIVETTFFPAVYHRFCHMLDRGRPYLLSGRVEQDWGAITLTVTRVSPLPPLQTLARATATRPDRRGEDHRRPDAPLTPEPDDRVVQGSIWN
jgi:DNA polymerase III alpha subunit